MARVVMMKVKALSLKFSVISHKILPSLVHGLTRNCSNIPRILPLYILFRHIRLFGKNVKYGTIVMSSC